jgi:hypothetical protein
MEWPVGIHVPTKKQVSSVCVIWVPMLLLCMSLAGVGDVGAPRVATLFSFSVTAWSVPVEALRWGVDCPPHASIVGLCTTSLLPPGLLEQLPSGARHPNPPYGPPTARAPLMRTSIIYSMGMTLPRRLRPVGPPLRSLRTCRCGASAPPGMVGPSTSRFLSHTRCVTVDSPSHPVAPYRHCRWQA